MGEFLEYFKQKKNLANLLLLGIMVLAIPLAVTTLRQQQIIKSRAAQDPIVFKGSSTNPIVDLPGDKKGFKLNSEGKAIVSLELTSPLGPAVQTQTVWRGLVNTVYAQECTPGNRRWDCDRFKSSTACSGSCVGVPQLCTDEGKWDDADREQCTTECTGCAAPPPAGGCNDVNDCPINNEPCKFRTCTNRVCGLNNAPVNAPCGAGLVCNGDGTCISSNNTNYCTDAGYRECKPGEKMEGTCETGGKTGCTKYQAGYKCNFGGKNYCDGSFGCGEPCSGTPPGGKTGDCTVDWSIPSSPAANSSFKVTVTGKTDPLGYWDNAVWRLDSGAWNKVTDNVTAGPTFTFTVPNSGAAGSHKLDFALGSGARVCIPKEQQFTVGGGTTANCPADSNLTISPNPAKIGDTMTFQYKPGEDVYMGTPPNSLDSWSGGISPNPCTWDSNLENRKFTCKAQSAVKDATWQHKWNNGANCGSATYTINAAEPIVVNTTKFRIAESPSDLSSAQWQTYTAHPQSYNFEFKDKKPGPKFIFVQFQDSAGNLTSSSNCPNCQAQIKLLGADPTITSCSLSFEGTNTILNLKGKNFGSEKGKVKRGENDLQIKQWKDENVQAILSNAQAGEALDVTLSNIDGQSGEGKCSSVSQLSLGAKVFCRVPAAHSTENIDLTLAGAFEGGTKAKQKVTIDKEGVIQGLNQKLEAGKKYKISLKAPKSLRKTTEFTAESGTTNIPNFVLPVGDIFPADGGDGTINTLDKSELNRQWIIAADASNRSADFNKDGRVNSIDWGCMRYDFGASDDSEAAVGVSQNIGVGATNPTVGIGTTASSTGIGTSAPR